MSRSHKEGKTLKTTYESIEKALSAESLPKDFDIHLSNTKLSYMKYKRLLEELNKLLEKDKWGELSDIAQEYVSYSQHILDFALKAINDGTDRWKPAENAPSRSSRGTRRSALSRASSSSSASARRKAMAEAAAAKKKAEFDRIIAVRENERKLFEAEEELRLKRRRAQHEVEMAILAAEKAEAIANAKLDAVEQSILKEESSYLLLEQKDVDVEDTESRTKAWVDTHSDPKRELPDRDPGNTFAITPNTTGITHKPLAASSRSMKQDQAEQIETKHLVEHTKDERATSLFTPKGFAGNPPIFTPVPSIPSPTVFQECIEGIAKTNERVVASLARQNLPKCHPEVFEGDATLFQPWKKAFEAMIQDANLNPNQEMAYLRNYTKGKVRELVDNYRKRQRSDPAITLRELWTEIGRRFGNTAIITNSLLERLQQTAKFNGRDKAKLQDFADVCMDVDNQINNLPGLACLNYASAIRPIVDNLPSFLRFKWEKKVVSYAEENNDDYPGFHTFAVMIQKQARLKNHPNVSAGGTNPDNTKNNEKRGNNEQHNKVYKVDAKDSYQNDQTKQEKHCYYHDRNGHELPDCKAFETKKFEEKMEWLKAAGLCFRCLSGKHRAKDCKKEVKCSKCESTRHLLPLHKEKEPNVKEEKDGEEEVKSKCTSVCRGKAGGVSCSKIVLVDVFTEDNPETVRRAYAIVDEQSNASMITPNLADMLEIDAPREKYLLSTCSSARETKYGRRVSGVMVKSLSGTVAKLPKLIECEHIPQDKDEIPTPSMTKHFPHLHDITNEIPSLDKDANIEILLGRDAPELLKVREFRNGPKGAPWAQKLLLGWTISGQTCLDRAGGPVHVSAYRTALEREPSNTRSTYVSGVPPIETVPCSNYFKVKENHEMHFTGKENQDDVYYTTPEDNDPALSREDRQFLKIVEEGIHKNASGNWEMPLPFRSENIVMPNNRAQALNRLNGLLRAFKRKPHMQRDYLRFMSDVIDRGHAEVVPVEESGESPRTPPAASTKSTERTPTNVWYLPHFGVYHPRKPDHIRVVFDSSCEFQGVSLNKELLAGPDLMNNLLGVLMRFRQENHGVMCDIERMFYAFHVNPEHRDLLRFVWFKNNDPKQEIIDYRMTVHLFGNGPSPAVATYGMRKTAEDGEEAHGTKTKEFICNNFYVDDGLTFLPTEEEVIDLVQNAQACLETANLHLHKVASNSALVMEAFPPEDRVKDVKDLDLRQDVLPTQRALGVQWNLEDDQLTFSVSVPEKPLTRRGVLSIVNSLYDPLGLVAPVVLVGKLLLQKLLVLGREKTNDQPLRWDDPLPSDLNLQWHCWKNQLAGLENVSINRCYHPKNFGVVVRNEVHAFSDASKEAIGVAAYLKQLNEKGEASVSLVFGQAKVAPIRPTSIPRLELCAAVLSTKAVKKLRTELDLTIDNVKFYTDSKVVLGYIYNDARRFHVYVANRVQTIRDISEPHQWSYVETSRNPADLATRGTTVMGLIESNWLEGPSFLKTKPEDMQSTDATTPPVMDEIAIDENDPEVRVNAYVTSSTGETALKAKRFERFSDWTVLQRAIAYLITKIKQQKASNNTCSTEHGRKDKDDDQQPTVKERSKAAKIVIIKAVQSDVFAEEIDALKRRDSKEAESRNQLKERRRLLRKSNLVRLDPFLDRDGILRVGGRLNRSSLTFEEKHPIFLPKKHHLSQLIIRHYHEKVVHHQGRQITHGAVRQAGFWVVNGHGETSRIIRACVTCKKLRGRTLTQHMADLPADRTETHPPFTNVGMDVFGPWHIQVKKLRGAAANAKRWGLVFTCLSSRGIHIEILHSMDANSFICALRRFFAIRGPAAILRCDCGTNFVGAKSELDGSLKEMDKERVQRYVTEQGCEWKFNPPHASHFGGVWERQIGTIRRVLDAMLLKIGAAQLDDELLLTLMAEVSSIVNNRPITAVSADTDTPVPLSPSMLLTMKQKPLLSPPGVFVREDLYTRKRWRRVQYLAEQFWLRWKREFLQNLQSRTKWNERERNLACGDVVLLKDKDLHRNDWSLGRVTEGIESEDGKVRKARIMTFREGTKKTVFRPINELVLLLSTSSEQ
jgi:hypothetical protein